MFNSLWYIVYERSNNYYIILLYIRSLNVIAPLEHYLILKGVAKLEGKGKKVNISYIVLVYISSLNVILFRIYCYDK